MNAVATLEAPIRRRSSAVRGDVHPELTMDIIDSQRGRLGSGFYAIEPHTAQTILSERNGHNRSFKVVKVRQLKSDMESGAFVPNGQSVIFSSDGVLLDGQNRLRACVDSGKSIVSNVAFGVHPSAQPTIDQGAPRSAGDVLQLNYGFTNGNNIAAVARTVIGYRRAGASGGLGGQGDASVTDIVEAVLDDPAIAEATYWSLALRVSVKGVVSTSHLGAALYLGERSFGYKAREYLERVATGEGLLCGDPALVARNRLIAEKTRSKMLGLEVLLRGMIAYVEGRSLTRIQLDGRLPKLPRRREGNRD